MLESHFVAQKSGNEKGEPGKSPQEEKIKALDRQLNIELKVKAGAENMIETCQRNISLKIEFFDSKIFRAFALALKYF